MRVYVCSRIFIFAYLYLHIYICIFIFAYLYLHIYICIFIFAYLYLHIYICIFECLCKCLKVRICVCTYVCMYVRMYVCMYVRMYVYMYVLVCPSRCSRSLFIFFVTFHCCSLFPTSCLLSSHCQDHSHLSLLFFHPPLSYFNVHFNPLHWFSSSPLSSFIFFLRPSFPLLLCSLFLYYLPPSLLLLSTSPLLVLSYFSLLCSPTHIRNVQLTTPYRTPHRTLPHVLTGVDYSSDVCLGDGIIKQVSESYRKLRNTLRYLLGTLRYCTLC